MKECNKEYIYLKTLCGPIFYTKTTYITDECVKKRGLRKAPLGCFVITNMRCMIFI